MNPSWIRPWWRVVHPHRWRQKRSFFFRLESTNIMLGGPPTGEALQSGARWEIWVSSLQRTFTRNICSINTPRGEFTGISKQQYIPLLVNNPLVPLQRQRQVGNLEEEIVAGKHPTDPLAETKAGHGSKKTVEFSRKKRTFFFLAAIFRACDILAAGKALIAHLLLPAHSPRGEFTGISKQQYIPLLVNNPLVPLQRQRQVGNLEEEIVAGKHPTDPLAETKAGHGSKKTVEFSRKKRTFFFLAAIFRACDILAAGKALIAHLLLPAHLWWTRVGSTTCVNNELSANVIGP